MERLVFQAAQQGNVVSLVGLIRADPFVLDRILADCFSETPLHVAAMLGHVGVVREIVSLKPQFTRELNLNKSSPLHLASARGFIDVVRALISVDVEMCVALDKDGRNPLHLAAMKGRVDVLKELLQAIPDAARATPYRGETILHMCVMHNQLEAMKLIIEIISDQDFLNAKNDDGNTILHMAVANKQTEIINYLLLNTSIEVNTISQQGLTAMDILIQSQRDVKDMDMRESSSRVGAVAANYSLQLSTQVTRITNQENNFDKENQDWLEKKFNTLMIVASLIATMTFQVGVNPTGGFWQETKEGHVAGSSIWAHINPFTYSLFVLFNTISFTASLCIILLLISGLPLKRKVFVWILMVIMWVAITATASTYVVSIHAETVEYADGSVQNIAIITVYLCYAWMGLTGLLLLWHSIRFAVKIRITLCKFLRKKRLEYVNKRNANVVTV